VADGILQALDETKTTLPLVIRLAGTNANEARQMINRAQLPNLTCTASLTEAARQAIASARGIN
ncbi:MAG: succinate--CoA ligase subunit beta, partial [Anaerolineae bacterium]|nr:succinate--CoA ligase subunit beta [Anaerolineae bacterium]